jgi:hypothetical protein
MRKEKEVIYNAHLHIHTHTHNKQFSFEESSKRWVDFLRPSFSLDIHYLNEVVTNGIQKPANQLPELLTSIGTDTSNGLSSLPNLAVRCHSI